MSVVTNPYRPPCLICRKPTLPSVVTGAPSMLCEECKSKPASEPTTEWGRGRKAERERAKEAQS